MVILLLAVCSLLLHWFRAAASHGLPARWQHLHHTLCSVCVPLAINTTAAVTWFADDSLCLHTALLAVEAPISTAAGQALQGPPPAGSSNGAAAAAAPAATEGVERADEKFNW